MIPLSLLPDRAKALEESWETAWENVIGNTRFATPFGAAPNTDT